MSNSFKEASRLKLRFTTALGPVSVEDLWILKYNDLVALGNHLAELVEKSTKKGGLFSNVAKSKEDKLNELRLQIVKEVFDDLNAEKEAAAASKEAEKEVLKWDALIAEKEAETAKSLSLDELKARKAEALAKLSK